MKRGIFQTAAEAITLMIRSCCSKRPPATMESSMVGKLLLVYL